MHRLNALIKNVLVICLVSGFLLVLIEGLSGSFLFLKRFLTNAPYEPIQSLNNQTTAFMIYDPQLGWANKKNADVKDVYKIFGPNRHVKTNSLGFRNYRDTSLQKPANKLRIICNGDSYTFGEGVDNTETWCYDIAKRNPAWDAVNVATNAYGIDQMYLKYKRDLVDIEHDIHFLAIVSDDVIRMKGEYSVNGPPRPYFILENGDLILKNTPVPYPWRKLNWVKRRSYEITQLSSFELFRKIVPAKIPFEHPVETRKAIALKAIEKMRDLSRQNEVEFIVLYLPVFPAMHTEDYQLKIEILSWFREELEKRKIPLWEVNFKNYALSEALENYIPQNMHYSPKGHKVVAHQILERIHQWLAHSNKFASNSQATTFR